MNLDDTILAISSPPGSAPRGLIRLSGPDAWALAATVLPLPAAPPSLAPGWYPNLALPLLHPTARLASLLLFRAPRSFTGQDIAELHLPGSPALLRAALAQLLDNAKSVGGLHGLARLADPGEFSARAFFNHKIDLTEAEGIAATINAANETQLRAAASLREGMLYTQINSFAEQLANLLALIEAGIDFSDEEGISFITLEQVRSELSQIGIGLHHLLAHAVRVDRLDSQPTVVFIGKPNVGKSSLINALTGENRSIVSPIAGTTRDMLTVGLQTNSGLVRLIDVPGEEAPTDELRQKMMAARELALMEADLIIEVLADEHLGASDLLMTTAYGAERYTVRNKADLLTPAELRTEELVEGKRIPLCAPWQLVSARTGLHIDQLREEIGRLACGKSLVSANLPALNQRHRLILQECNTSVRSADAHTNCDPDLRHPELLAAELRRALDLLGQITGTISPDEVLGRIFSRFCIGK